jgi:hypothetical protein
MKTTDKTAKKNSGEQIIQKKIEESRRLLKGIDLNVFFKEVVK